MDFKRSYKLKIVHTRKLQHSLRCKLSKCASTATAAAAAGTSRPVKLDSKSKANEIRTDCCKKANNDRDERAVTAAASEEKNVKSN